MKTSKYFIMALFCLTVLASCSDDDDNPPPVNEEELITNVTLTFTNTADAGDVVVLANVAPDGQDGAFTNTITGDFTAGATYSLELDLSKVEDGEVEDVLDEDIIPEADEHFFVYAVNGINLTMTRDADDIDGPDDNKLGVFTTWVAGAASTGNINITLVHEPTSVDDSANNNFGSATGGSEDFNITFIDVEIQ